VKIILTQQHGRLENLGEALQTRGFEVLHAPLLRTETLRDANLEALRDCTWWLFTSASAVHAVAELEGFRFAPGRIGVVGRATADALRATAKLEANLISPVETARGLAGALLDRGERGVFGWLRGERALPDLKHDLEIANCEVREVIVYRTQTLEFPDVQADVIVLASPSAVEALPLEIARNARLIALGSSTASAVRERGLEVVTATAPSVRGVLDALEELNGVQVEEMRAPRVDARVVTGGLR
jgi:uroporphyrinogen-III synthase